MRNEVRLSFVEFVEMQSPQAWAELNSIDVTERYSFARSLEDFDEDTFRKPSELPFAYPEAAKAALRKKNLEQLVWRDACSKIDVDQWECRARPEDDINWKTISAKLLTRAIPNFATGSFCLLGQGYEDVEFVRTSPISADEKALRIIQCFCRSHDPGAHRVEDVRHAIEVGASLEMSDGHVRGLMKRASLDDRWFAPGRRSARCAACKP